MVTHAAIMRIEPRHILSPGLPEAHYPDGMGVYYVFYRVLKRGKKPMRLLTIRGRDEMDAYLLACKELTKLGYKV